MSGVFAASPTSELPLDDLAARIRAHGWVQDASADLPFPANARACAVVVTVLVVPSAAGACELRRRGKGLFVAELERHLRGMVGGCTPACDWRLVEAIAPLAQRAAAPASLAAQPWMPIVSDLVVDRAAQSLTCRLMVPYDLPVFRGHFPTRPIVPGVVQLGWAVELAHAHELAVGRLTGIVTAKFRRLLQPGMRVDALLERCARRGQLQFVYRLGNTVVSTGRLQFGGGGG